ncbi:MAG: cbb3-type cytochrome oxidase assembly protein CcoS [Holophagales bacterium]|nr:MAG: cbb3-type cytochrome oxidase assembly protein CcoS [Holophagales bacterium]
METIFVLLPLALLIAAIAVGFFIWAARSGQFDDLDTPAVRILFDDEEPHRPATVASSASARRPAGEGREASGAAMTPADPTRRVPE